MERMTVALIIITFLFTASAKPIGWQKHHNADASGDGRKQACLGRNSWWSWLCKQPSAESDKSWDSWESSDSKSVEESEENQSMEDSQESESEEDSRESESEEDSPESESEEDSPESESKEDSSEETPITDRHTTPGPITTVETPTTTGEGITVTCGPDESTDDPDLIVTPPPPEITTADDVTTPDNVTHEIPTPAPTTHGRGDN